jgi:hypothetical protein
MSSELAKIAKEIGTYDQFKTMDKYLAVVNQEPLADWIIDHPLASGVKYLPIDKVEAMLTELFQQYKVEVLREGQMLNAVYVTVRLHYLHPITQEWTFQDGIAAVPIKVKKGENASNLSAILFDAIGTGLPSAKSYAIKDAADHIGKAFGRDLNRKDTVSFMPAYDDDAQEDLNKAIEAIKATKTVDELKKVYMALPAKVMTNSVVIETKNEKYMELA